MARSMGLSPLYVAACCMLVWAWAEDVTENGLIEGVTAADVSFAAGIEGIAEAMVEAGWLIETGDAVALPNWDRHNGEPAKRRAVDAMRKRVRRREDKLRTLRGRLS